MTPKSIEWLEKNGKKVVYYNFKGLKSEEFQNGFKAIPDFIHNLDEKYDVLSILDVTDAVIDPAVVKHAQAAVEKTKHRVHKNAIIGLTGAKRKVFDMVMRFTGGTMKPFDTLEEALEYVTS